MDINETMQQTDMTQAENQTPPADTAPDSNNAQLSPEELAIQLEESNKKLMTMEEEFNHLTNRTQTLDKLREIGLSKELLPYVMGKTTEESAEKIAGLYDVVSAEVTKMLSKKFPGYTPKTSSGEQQDSSDPFLNALKGR